MVSLWFSARSWRSNWATSRGGAWPSLQRSRMIRDDPDESELEAMAQSKSWIYPAIKYWMCPSFVYHVYQRVNHVKFQFVMDLLMIFMVNPPCWMKMDEIQGLGPFRPIPKKNARDASCAIAEVAVKARAAARQKAPEAPVRYGEMVMGQVPYEISIPGKSTSIGASYGHRLTKIAIPSGKLLHNHGKYHVVYGKSHYQWPFSIAM